MTNQNQGPGPGPSVPAAGGPRPTSPDDRTMAVIAHASSLVAMVVSAGSLSFLGPLLVWLVYKDRSPYVRQAAAGAFNFNVGMWVLSVAGYICIFTIIGLPLGLLLLGLSALGQLVMHIIGTLRALDGRPYRYPLQIRILR